MNTKPLLLGVVAFAAATSLAQSGIAVVIDGETVNFDGTGPMRSHGRVLVPMRGVLEKLGATVGWDPAAQMITAERGDKKIELTIGRAFGRINDEDFPMDVPAKIFKGTTFVPLRFMSAALGAKVSWDEAKSTVTIQTAGGGMK